MSPIQIPFSFSTLRLHWSNAADSNPMMWFNLPDQLEFVGIIIPFLSAKTALYIWLVVLTILKNMKVNGKDYPIYYGKIKKLQTTNQYIYIWNRKLGRIHVLIEHWYFPHDKSSFSHEKNKVTRTYTTVCFWHPCAKTPHVLSFFQWPISTSDDEKFQEPFFPISHVVAMSHLDMLWR